MNAREFARMLDPIRHRLKMMVTRGVLQRVDDTKKMQVVDLSLLADELKANVERFQQYGLTTVPLPGAEAFTLFLGGNRDHGITIAIEDRRYRMKGLASGEVAVYDDLGQFVLLKRERIEVYSPLRVDVRCHDVRLGLVDPGAPDPDVNPPEPLDRHVEKLVDARFQVRFDGHRHEDAGGTGLSGAVTPADRMIIDEDTTTHTRGV